MIEQIHLMVCRQVVVFCIRPLSRVFNLSFYNCLHLPVHLCLCKPDVLYYPPLLTPPFHCLLLYSPPLLSFLLLLTPPLHLSIAISSSLLHSSSLLSTASSSHLLPSPPETNYVEDVLAAGSFFHYAGGFSKPESFDLTLPETNPVGKLKGAISVWCVVWCNVVWCNVVWCGVEDCVCVCVV